LQLLDEAGPVLRGDVPQKNLDLIQAMPAEHLLRLRIGPGHDQLALLVLVMGDQDGRLHGVRAKRLEPLVEFGDAVRGEEAAAFDRDRQDLRVALVDIDLGSESGFDLARRLADDVDGSGPRLILISTHDEREFVKLIESSPAVGFLAKTELSAERIYRLLEQAGG